MTLTTSNPSQLPTPNYGIDGPAVLRNLFLFGSLCLIVGLQPYRIHLGPVFIARAAFLWTAGFLLVEACLYLYYVKVGKLRHRDLLLGLYPWRGDEQVLDVGCGRGLLLAGAAKLLPDGHATGIDLWSNVDMGKNSAAATLHNLTLENVAARTDVLSMSAQAMTFPDAHFDVIVSNLCLHNIYDQPTRQKALAEIVRVLKPGGVALISDYKLTREYARAFTAAGLGVTRKHGSWLNFPHLTIVEARKPR